MPRLLKENNPGEWPRKATTPHQFRNRRPVPNPMSSVSAGCSSQPGCRESRDKYPSRSNLPRPAVKAIVPTRARRLEAARRVGRPDALSLPCRVLRIGDSHVPLWKLQPYASPSTRVNKSVIHSTLCDANRASPSVRYRGRTIKDHGRHPGGPTITSLAPCLAANFLALSSTTDPRGASTTISAILPVNVSSLNTWPSRSRFCLRPQDSAPPAGSGWDEIPSAPGRGSRPADPASGHAATRHPPVPRWRGRR